MREPKQIAKTLNYCKEHGSITVRDMCTKLEINSPTKVISVMRHSPLYKVESVEEAKVKEGGETVRYNRYFISKVASANG
jgi:hypothetical protein